MTESTYTWSASWTRAIEVEPGYTVYVIPTAIGLAVATVYLDDTDVAKDMTELQIGYDGYVRFQTYYGKAYSQRYCTRLARELAHKLQVGL